MRLEHLSLEDVAALVRGREVSPVELTAACLRRIERLEPQLDAFISVTGDRALREARKAEAEIQAGEYRGPLHGVPLTIKDLFDLAGTLTTAGSPIPTEIATKDSAVAAGLINAGAVILGKTNLHEWAFGVTSENIHFGTVKNPWLSDRISGGSSGGSAAAVATDLCYASVGSDTGGSIRIPAALCGVVGLKPTYGRVSLRGAVPLAWSLDHAGPLARAVRDAAIVFAAIAGYDPLDPGSANQPSPDYLGEIEDGVRGFKLGLVPESLLSTTEPGVVSALRVAADVFKGLGAEIAEAQWPNSKEINEAQGTIITSETLAFHSERLRDQPTSFDPSIARRIAKGETHTAADYARSRRRQAEFSRAFDQLLLRYDALLMPSTPRVASLIGSAEAATGASWLTAFTSPFNLTGLPAISVPCGFNEGLPVGLQIVGPRWQEAKLLRIARAYERETDWHSRWPPMAC